MTYSEVTNPYIKALENYDYRVIDIANNFELLAILEDNVRAFVHKNGKVLQIPLKDMDGMIFGYVYRSLRGKFFHVEMKSKTYPNCFGLQDFSNFQFNQPILVCEGVKDVMVLKKVYPYALAYLTSQPSDMLFDYLTQITNKIIWFPDNDRVGRMYETKWKEKYKYFSKYYCPYGKDLGSYFDNDKPQILEWVRTILIKEGVIYG